MNMKLVSSALGLLLAVPTLLCAAQESSGTRPFDLGTGVTSRQRFLLYPHLQKGLEAMRRGDRARAVDELEHARSLAPDSAAVALILAQAYATFGDNRLAESVLREQLKRTPHDIRLGTALTKLQVAARVPATASNSPHGLEASTRPSEVPRTAAVARSMPVTPARARAERATPEHSDATAPAESIEYGARFTRALQAGRFDDAQQEADLMLAESAGRAALLDELTYRLVEAGASDQAARVLMHAYPFATGAPAERDALLQRLGLLVGRQRTILSAEELLPLREPLDTPALRSLQAVIWESVQDCAAIRAVLSDRSSEYGYDDWLRLGDCSAADAGSARQAYARAHALRPGGRASRALAYGAYDAGDYPTALEAWRSVGADRLFGDELLGAATTALAAGANEQAVTWLNAYRERGDTPDHRYWSLLAGSLMNSDSAAAAAALERAIEVGPEADDYVRLARLQSDSQKQIQALQHAAQLDPANLAVQLDLGYAYTRAGLAASALAAFQRAAALDPESVTAAIELGYAYWRNGHAAQAQGPLERAWRADPGNQMVAQQLVYVYQRLSLNQQARAFAERVLDASSVPGEAATAGDIAGASDRRFGFQRLHEDLDRRLTLSLDGFSGTNVGAATSGPQTGRGYRSYAQLEADVRLGGSPVRNGSTFSAYARLLADGGEPRRPVPSQNTVLGLGLKWKPWGSRVIYFAAEHQTALEDRSRQDVMLRASASFLNGGRYGDDWHPSGNGWVSRNLYIDAARYLDANYSAVTIDYRTSYHRKVSAQQTLEPYVRVQLSGIENSRIDRDVRSGLGLRWNIWTGATHYDAPPHKLSVGIEFQQAFTTYLSDRNGLFVTLGTRW
jgi:bacteriophage N4 adsorption protein A